MRTRDLLEAGLLGMIAYGIYLCFKWALVLGWPYLIIYGIAKLFGGSPDIWESGTKNFLWITSVVIALPTYLWFSRKKL